TPTHVFPVPTYKQSTEYSPPALINACRRLRRFTWAARRLQPTNWRSTSFLHPVRPRLTCRVGGVFGAHRTKAPLCEARHLPNNRKSPAVPQQRTSLAFH